MRLSEFSFEGGHEVGRCTEDGETYSLRTGDFKGERLMVVISKRTGRSFIVSWSDLIDLAKDVGINKPHKSKEAA